MPPVTEPETISENEERTVALCDAHDQDNRKSSKAKKVKRNPQRQSRMSCPLLQLLQHEQKTTVPVEPELANQCFQQLTEQLQMVASRIQAVFQRKEELYAAGIRHDKLRPAIGSHLEMLELEQQKLLVYYQNLQVQYQSCYAQLQQKGSDSVASSSSVPPSPVPIMTAPPLIGFLPAAPVQLDSPVPLVSPSPVALPSLGPLALMEFPLTFPTTSFKAEDEELGAHLVSRRTRSCGSRHTVHQRDKIRFEAMMRAAPKCPRQEPSGCSSSSSSLPSVAGSAGTPALGTPTDARGGSSVVFRTLSFYLCGYSTDESKDIELKIRAMGGELLSELSDNVTHVVAKYQCESTRDAEAGGAAVCTAQWVSVCHLRRTLFPIELPAHLPLPSADPVPGFPNLTFAITGWAEKENRWMRWETQYLIQALGGKLQPTLTKEVDMLIAEDGIESEKLLRAFQWNICVASYQWILRCASEWKMVNLTRYVRRPPFLDQPRLTDAQGLAVSPDAIPAKDHSGHRRLRVHCRKRTLHEGSCAGSAHEAGVARRVCVLFGDPMAPDCTQCADIVLKLGGVASGSEELLNSCGLSMTHVVVRCLQPSVGLLLALAAGRWVLRPEFVYESHRQGAFVEEAPFEWDGDEDVITPEGEVVWAGCPRRWRTSSMRPFQGMQFGIYLLEPSQRCWGLTAQSLGRILEAGGAIVFYPPFDRSKLKMLFADKDSLDPAVLFDLVSAGVQCYDLAYAITKLCRKNCPEMDCFRISVA
eukprot:RCo006450